MALPWYASIAQKFGLSRPKPPEPPEEPPASKVISFPPSRRVRIPPSTTPTSVPRKPAEPLSLAEFAPQRDETTPEPSRMDDAALTELARSVFKGVQKIVNTTPPSFPWFASQVIEAAENPRTDTRDLARLISSDALIASQVLRVANSARYAGESRVVNLPSAIARLGLVEVGKIAFVTSAQAILSPASQQAFEDFPNLWRLLWYHSISTSLSAGWLAARVGGMEESTVFLGGLLHDVGKMFGLQAIGTATREGWLPKLSPADTGRLLEMTHVQIGEQVAEICKYPAPIFAICRDHHPRVLPIDPRRRDLAAVILTAHFHDLVAGARVDEACMTAAVSCAQTLGLDQPLLRVLATQVAENQAKAQAIMATAAA
jgi:HD-like signal output (HDOD) protein